MYKIIEYLLTMQTQAEMSEFFDGLLTEKEKLELPRRLEIVRMLKRGIPQHTIAQKLGVGVATVTRGSKEIQMGRFKSV